MFKLSGKRPATLGSNNGKLAPVVKKSNNVSSQADVNDRAHYVAPLKFTGEAEVAFQNWRKDDNSPLLANFTVDVKSLVERGGRKSEVLG